MTARVPFTWTAILAVVLAWGYAANAQQPLGTSFSYEGELRLGGSAVTEPTDFRVSLWNAQTGGDSLGSTLVFHAVEMAEGRFALVLDFGQQFEGQKRWIEIQVRSPAGAGDYVTLTPRQEIKPTPFALFALSGNAGPAGPQGAQGPQGEPGPPGRAIGATTTSAETRGTSSSWQTIDTLSVTVPQAGVLLVNVSAQTGPSRYGSGEFATWVTYGVEYRVSVGGVQVCLAGPFGSSSNGSSASQVMGVSVSLAGARTVSAGTHTVSVEARVASNPGWSASLNSGSGTHKVHNISAVLLPSP
ncbi:MAG: hypothetical protein KF859_07035 [Phycisphaeraceae bacterium]|nr:hypothetical protein [Phycisphaeraceae bacterium]